MKPKAGMSYSKETAWCEGIKGIAPNPETLILMSKNGACVGDWEEMVKCRRKIRLQGIFLNLSMS